MNLNEECLLHFLKNPNGLDDTLEQLKTYLFSKDNSLLKENNNTQKEFFDSLLAT